MTDFSTISSAAETISGSGAKDFPQEVAKEEGLTLASNFLVQQAMAQTPVLSRV